MELVKILGPTTLSQGIVGKRTGSKWLVHKCLPQQIEDLLEDFVAECFADGVAVADQRYVPIPVIEQKKNNMQINF
jgi:hypothetical protein